MRLYVRHIEFLILQRTQCKNRIHTVLVRYDLISPTADPFGVDGRGYRRRGRNGAKLINYRQMPRAEFYHSICDAILQAKTPEEAPADG